MKRTLFAVGSLLSLAVAACSDMGSSNPLSTGGIAKPATITVKVDQPGPQINQAMWGAFFEDINFGADGGLYAELVKNRGFEFPDAMMGWSKISPSLAKGDVTVRTDSPWRETNAHYVRIDSKAGAPLGITNEGFRGMGMKAGDFYDFAAQVRVVSGNPRVSVEIVGGDGTTLASARLTPPTGPSNTWSKATATLRSKDTDPHSRLAVFVEGGGTVDLDFISLFPQKTWKNRPGGLRADMVQALADLHPGFLRFPGGCIVEGSELDKRYQWKNTIGPVEDRKLLVNRWNYEFKHRPTPDYYQSFGMGFFEFFQLCEDIGAQPLPILNCGMACQFNSGELCPVEDLGPYIQDALDLIEFANGPATSTWGAKRAAMGHTEPFHLTMMGVGNEQWGPQYLERLAAFTKVLKEKHPEISLVSGAGPSPEDERFDFLWPKLQQMKADIVDQHCYANPVWFLSNTHRYDNYDRNGPKVFFGEYATQTVAIVSTKNRNNLEAALSEAACMTGLEKNADVVRMASYAPLFSNVDAWQWTPDLMWTNSLQLLKTPNYYVQQLFCTNKGDVVLPTTNDAPVQDMLPAGKIGLGTTKSSVDFKDIRVSRGEEAGGGRAVFTSTFSADASGWTGGDSWKVTDGTYQQTDDKANAVSHAGDAAWTDYTLTLKFRKTGGTDGPVFTVLDDGKGSWVQWHLGGWGNTQNGIVTHYAEQDQQLERLPGTLETGKWYDVKIAIKGAHIDCYLDGKLIQSAEVLHHQVPALFTTASRDNKTGETILKVVNPGNQPYFTTINLQGAAQVESTASATVITGMNTDENTFDKENIVPHTRTIYNVGHSFQQTFPARSITVLRIAERAASIK